MNETAEALATRQAILDAATDLLGERDYPATSIRDIARAVGLLPGSMYAYVENKESILYQIVQSGIDRFVAMVEDIADDGQAPDVQIRRAIVGHIQLVSQNPRRVLVVFHQWRYLGPDNRRKVVAMRARYEQFFRDTIDAGIKAGLFRADLDVRYPVFSILGALNWLPEWLPQGAPDVDAVGERIADLLLDGLADQQR
jgi:AcrR family transcriptional regulator